MTKAEDKRSSILWTALGCRASKLARRDLLDEGSATAVEATILAKVGRTTVEEVMTGRLTVGTPTKRNVSVAAPAEYLLAYLLAEIPDAKAAKLLESIAQQFEQKKKTLPKPDPKHLATAKAWQTRLRGAGTQNCAAAVSFLL